MIEEVIKKIPFFNGLSKEELYKIVAVGQEISVGKSQLIFEEGNSADHMYIIIEGQVRIFSIKDGEETPISTLKKWCFFW